MDRCTVSFIHVIIIHSRFKCVYLSMQAREYIISVSFHQPIIYEFDILWDYLANNAGDDLAMHPSGALITILYLGFKSNIGLA